MQLNMGKLEQRLQFGWIIGLEIVVTVSILNL